MKIFDKTLKCVLESKNADVIANWSKYPDRFEEVFGNDAEIFGLVKATNEPLTKVDATVDIKDDAIVDIPVDGSKNKPPKK
ncbi:MAG: hypothetical protein FWG64_02035 [Firmicutes bacterium]|nr:hypothetical protein [Bacillota bacterium]